jgi:hypothetical protein
MKSILITTLLFILPLISYGRGTKYYCDQTTIVEGGKHTLGDEVALIIIDEEEMKISLAMEGLDLFTNIKEISYEREKSQTTYRCLSSAKKSCVFLKHNGSIYYSNGSEIALIFRIKKVVSE